MHGHRADLAAALPDLLPALARIGGAEDAAPQGHVAADVGLARADVHDARIGRRHGDRADRLGWLVVEHRLPVPAAVLTFPYTTLRKCSVVDQGLARHPGDASDAPG